MARKYTVTDGRMVLTLEEAEKGWYVVTAPFEPGVITQARSVSEAFEMARDALKGLRKARRDLAQRSLKRLRKAG